uniref:Uncharacterized protein n=1 Tax=Helianthus annuus TaxID=4232 RepID=A0A251T6W0_HELAN
MILYRIARVTEARGLHHEDEKLMYKEREDLQNISGCCRREGSVENGVGGRPD